MALISEVVHAASNWQAGSMGARALYTDGVVSRFNDEALRFYDLGAMTGRKEGLYGATAVQMRFTVRPPATACVYRS